MYAYIWLLTWSCEIKSASLLYGKCNGYVLFSTIHAYCRWYTLDENQIPPSYRFSPTMADTTWSGGDDLRKESAPNIKETAAEEYERLLIVIADAYKRICDAGGHARSHIRKCKCFIGSSGTPHILLRFVIECSVGIRL